MIEAISKILICNLGILAMEVLRGEQHFHQIKPASETG
jgi:hypothetical protein